MPDEILHVSDELPRCFDPDTAPTLEQLLAYPQLSAADAQSFRARHRAHISDCPFCGPQFEIAMRRWKCGNPAVVVAPSPPSRLTSVVKWWLALGVCVLLSLGGFSTAYISTVAKGRLRQQLMAEEALRAADKEEAQVTGFLEMARNYSYVG